MQRVKIFVAMSGGVDSSVAAVLLKQAGFNVAGGFMKCWEEKDVLGNCTSAADEKAARQTARVLKIPLYVFDFTREYKKHVFEYFLNEYRAGRTPNPDVICNKEIKFGIFLDKARKLGFDSIATGHYARIQKIKTWQLLRGVDKNKDQSYFLWQLSQEQLKHCLFPVGDYTKPEVRALARKFKLPNAEKKDSQGICFIGKVKMADFLRKYIKDRPGKIVTTDGRIVGKHNGMHGYTIGQRHGIGLAGGPYWVLEKRIKDNVLAVARNEKDLYKKEVIVENVNWLSRIEPKMPLRLRAAIRYRQKPEVAVLTKTINANRYTLKFLQHQRAIASGQSAVFYRGQELLGGGIIV